MGNSQTAKSQLKSCRELTKFEERELKELFSFYKENRGKSEEGLPKLTIQALMEPLGWTSGEYVDRIFDFFDENGDGVVDFKEFVVGMSLLFKGDPEDKIRFYFEIYDLDGDGYLTEEEVSKIVKSNLKAVGVLLGSGSNLPMEEALAEKRLVAKYTARLFEDADKNGDQRISFAEFKHACKMNPTLRKFLSNTEKALADEGEFLHIAEK
ncbi:Calcium-binding protein NCS-1 [Balamuthia mandrillaris]